jgi:hypothetical protein
MVFFCHVIGGCQIQETRIQATIKEQLMQAIEPFGSMHSLPSAIKQ